MLSAFLAIRNRLDGFGVVLSALCAVHCVAGLVLVSLLGIGAGVLGSPAIHEVGLALAIGIGLFTLGLGVLRHGRTAPLAIGGAGLALMAAGLVAPHGIAEAILTICGVGLVAFAHMRNLREPCRALSAPHDH